VLLLTPFRAFGLPPGPGGGIRPVP
jgi:hypothetical protein